MLDAHADLAVANDTHFITRSARRELRRQADPALEAGLVERVASYHRFHRMGLEHEDVLAAARGADSYSSFVSRLYDIRAERAGKTLSGEKTPDYCRKMPVLHRLFPSARFLHIVRDGRDTALSTLRWAAKGKGPGRWSLWQKDPLGTCALWWCWQVGAARRDGAALGGETYREVRYEALVADPETELRGICAFLGISYDPRMPRFHEGKTRDARGRSAKSAWLGPTPGLRNWRTEMGDEDGAVFDALAGELLDKTGYERKTYAASQRVDARVRSCLDWWTDSGMDAEGVTQLGPVERAL
jgi:hypothetical protein